jgi:hypothetical protein
MSTTSKQNLFWSAKLIYGKSCTFITNCILSNGLLSYFTQVDRNCLKHSNSCLIPGWVLVKYSHKSDLFCSPPVEREPQTDIIISFRVSSPARPPYTHVYTPTKYGSNTYHEQFTSSCYKKEDEDVRVHTATTIPFMDSFSENRRASVTISNVSVSDLYNPRIGPHISCSRIGRPMVGI